MVHLCDPPEDFEEQGYQIEDSVFEDMLLPVKVSRTGEVLSDDEEDCSNSDSDEPEEPTDKKKSKSKKKKRGKSKDKKRKKRRKKQPKPTEENTVEETNKKKIALEDPTKCHYEGITVVRHSTLNLDRAQYTHNYEASPYFMLNKFDHT